MLHDAEDDARTVEYIKSSLPQDLKECFTDDDLYYFIDVLAEYYADLAEKSPDGVLEVEIDIEEVASHLCAEAKKDGIGNFSPEDVRWVVDAELDYGEMAEEE